jgi:hypothetical protein
MKENRAVKARDAEICRETSAEEMMQDCSI